MLPRVVEKVLDRRTYFKELLKKIPKENIEESFWCEQRIEALKKILVCCMALQAPYGTQYEQVGLNRAHLIQSWARLPHQALQQY